MQPRTDRPKYLRGNPNQFARITRSFTGNNRRSAITRNPIEGHEKQRNPALPRGSLGRVRGYRGADASLEQGQRALRGADLLFAQARAAPPGGADAVRLLGRDHGCLFDPGGAGRSRSNFRELVLGCIDAEFCNQSLI